MFFRISKMRELKNLAKDFIIIFLWGIFFYSILTLISYIFN